MHRDDTRPRNLFRAAGLGALALTVAGGCLGDDRSSPDVSLATSTRPIASATGGVAWASVYGGASPAIAHAHNSSGDPITVARTAVGAYTVTFVGQGHELAANLGNVQVVAIGEDSVRCGVRSMTRGGSPGPRRTITTSIQCWLPSGGAPLPSDSGFVVLYVQDRVGGFSSSRGYALVEGGNLITAKTFAPTAAAVEIFPDEAVPGSYYLAFGGSWPASGVVPLVTAHGLDGSLECHTTHFYPETGELFVGCFDQAGPAEGNFSVLLLASPPAPAGSVADTFHYVPDPENPFPTTGYPRFAAQSGPFGSPGPIGGYVLQYLFGTYPSGVLPVAGALGTESRYCKLESYVPTAPGYPVGDFNLAQVLIRCFDGAGVPAASDAAVAFTINGPVIIW